VGGSADDARKLRIGILKSTDGATRGRKAGLVVQQQSGVEKLALIRATAIRYGSYSEGIYESTNDAARGRKFSPQMGEDILSIRSIQIRLLYRLVI